MANSRLRWRTKVQCGIDTSSESIDMPSGRFPGAEVDAHSAKGCSTGLLGGTAEYIAAPGDFKALKSGR
jgi:hypothetical protein